MDLIKKVRAFIVGNKLIKTGEKIILGFSGGPDSVFLLEMLMKLKEEFALDLSLAHINHLLRGAESDADESFARETARRLGIPCYVKRESMQEYARKHKVGEEEAGREIRYSFFQEILQGGKGDKVALAHNLDDEIETFMFRLMRGSSLEGLEGIPVRRGKYIRPVLGLYKGEIMEYLHENDIEYRVDSSNLKNDYTRNSIRLDLIPEIERRYNKGFKEKIVGLMEEIREVNELLEVDYRSYMSGRMLDVEKIKALTDYEKKKVLRNYLVDHGIEVSRRKLESVLGLMEAGGSKELNLGKNSKLKKEYNKLYVSVNSKNYTNEVLQMKLEVPGEICFGRYKIKASCGDEGSRGRESFTAEIPKGSVLTVRKRRAGDRIAISREGTTKKLKEIFINSKTPKEVREEIPIVTLGEEIIWIAGVRGSELYRTKQPGENSIKLTVEEGNFSERGEE